MFRISDHSNACGAVLPFVAIILIAIVTFFGFVLDINMLASSREQAQHFARFAALAALEKFHDPRLRCLGSQTGAEVDLYDPDVPDTNKFPCSLCRRYQLAIERVNTLTQENTTVTAKEETPVLLPFNTSAANCGMIAGTGDEAVLVPGEMVSDNGDTPCADSNRRSPCFVELEITNGGNAPSAFGIQGKYYRGLSTMWSKKVMDGEADNLHNLRVDAIATLIPRRGCFLVDISASSVRDTHVRQSITRNDYRAYLRDGIDPPVIDPWGNEFAYFLGCPEIDQGADPSDPSDDFLTGTGFNCRTHDEENSQPDYTTLGDTRFIGANNLGGNYDNIWGNPAWPLWSNHDRTWEWLNLEKPTGAMSDRSPIHHFADSYVLKHVYGDADYDANHHQFNPSPTQDSNKYTTTFPDGAWFNIDMGMFDRSAYGGHQAVTTANGAADNYFGPEPLRSILAGIRTSIERFETRQVAGDMACVIFYDKSLTWPRVFNITDNFAELREIFNFDAINASVLQPDIDADITTATTGPVTGFEAIVRHGLFPRNPDNSFTNAVAAISEALTQLDNARQASGVESADFIVNISDGLTNCITCANPITGGCPDSPGTCSNEYNYYQQSMNDLRGSIQTIWADPAVRNIPLHVFMIGSAVGPHSLDIEEPDSDAGNRRCYPYHKVGGSGFSPVRGQDVGNNGLEDDFDNASSAQPFYQANVDWFEIAKLTRGLWAPIRPSPPSCTMALTDSNGNPCDPDNFGIGASNRRVVDPFCRTQDQQIVSYVDRILGDNPFQLVEPQWP